MQCTCHYSSPVTVSNCFLLHLSLLPPLRILIHNVQELVDQSTPDTSSQKQIPESYNYTQYHPMEEVKKKLSQFVLCCYFIYTMKETLCLQKALLKSPKLCL